MIDTLISIKVRIIFLVLNKVNNQLVLQVYLLQFCVKTHQFPLKKTRTENAILLLINLDKSLSHYRWYYVKPN